MKDNEFIMETFVTFEQAKALEELGFDGFKWDCDFWYYYNYVNHDEPIFARCEQVDSYDVEERWYAPTLAHAQKWLREVKGIDVTIDHVYHQLDSGNKIMYGLHVGDQSTFKTEFYMNYDSYEEAFIAGIDAALKILKTKIK